MSPHKKDTDHRFRSRSPLILMGAGVTGNAMTGGVLWITPAYAGKSYICIVKNVGLQQRLFLKKVMKIPLPILRVK